MNRDKRDAYGFPVGIHNIRNETPEERSRRYDEVALNIITGVVAIGIIAFIVSEACWSIRP